MTATRFDVVAIGNAIVDVIARADDDFLLAGQAALLHAIFAILTFACAQAHALVELILGERWMPMAALFQLLCIGGMFQAATNATYWVFLSKGLTGTHFRFTAISKPLLENAFAAFHDLGYVSQAAGQTLLKTDLETDLKKDLTNKPGSEQASRCLEEQIAKYLDRESPA